MEAALAEVQVLDAPHVGVACIWCKRDASDSAKWVTLNGRPMVPLCERCHKDVEKAAQAMIMFGRFVLPKMVKR